MAPRKKSASAATKNPPRSDVPVEDTWDLSKLFKSDAAWHRAYKQLERQIPEFAAFRGKLGRSAKSLRAALDFEVEFEKLGERVGSYAHLKSTENVADPVYQEMFQRYIYLATRAQEAASYMAPEIQAIPKKRMNEFLKSPHLEPYRFSLKKLMRYKPHILSEPEERLLAMQGEAAQTADRVFSQLTDADLRFGDVEDAEGKRAELTQGSFTTFLESRKRSVRKQAFHQFYDQFEAHGNTLAAALSGSVLQDIYAARVRNYPSAREAALFADNMPVSVYDNLITTVRDNLDAVYHYLEVRKKALKLKSLHMYDTYVPFVKGPKVNIPFDDAITTLAEAFEPLGNGYVSALENGLRNGRWADRYENIGKRSGAFSAGGFTGPPYILMNYKPTTYNGIYTLAHEAGHSMHTYYSARNQPFHYYHYTIFVAEVASTFNEQLLTRQLLAEAETKTERANLINKEIDSLRATLVRQTMFAEFEKLIHELAEAGQPLTLDVFRGEYRHLLEAYFGPGFTIDDQLTLECLRIPHFYHAFYVYKYATGISAAIALYHRVLDGGKKELNDYLGFLKSGGSRFPLDLLKGAGVDMRDPAPIQAAMDHMKALVAELEELT